MTDIAFSGLGSFVLFLFSAILFGFLILLLGIRYSLLGNRQGQQNKKVNSLILLSALIPFLTAIAGLIALEVFDNSPSVKMLFDQYIAIAMQALAILIAVWYVVTGLRKLEKLLSLLYG